MSIWWLSQKWKYKYCSKHCKTVTLNNSILLGNLLFSSALAMSNTYQPIYTIRWFVCIKLDVLVLAYKWNLFCNICYGCKLFVYVISYVLCFIVKKILYIVSMCVYIFYFDASLLYWENAHKIESNISYLAWVSYMVSREIW